MHLPTEVSESVKRRNPGLYGNRIDHAAITGVVHIVIHGQIKGGKNNMGINPKTGKHFPKADWARWRDAAVREVKAQLPKNHQPFSKSTLVTFGYYAGDKRRRDEPAIKDAVWHVLERAGVVHDDCLLWTTHSWRNYDKQNPRVELWLKEEA